ncbi:MAG: hypothetical protein ACI9VR_002771 [Cognaticolwellia sp.]|jgi:uncharacterized protein (TIGR02453 family)
MASIPTSLLDFMVELAENNNREWFAENKKRYEGLVKDPALAFISDFQVPLQKQVSPHFVAVAKGQGGSLFRIYRDTRFSKDKTPYKTYTGMHFRHELMGRDVHAPGFYLGLEPGNVGCGSGIWQPQKDALAAVRKGIMEHPNEWVQARDEVIAKGWSFMGQSLKRAPKGYDVNHPLIEDLRRKDFAVWKAVSEDELANDGAEHRLAAILAETVPTVQFLCACLDLPC